MNLSNHLEVIPGEDWGYSYDPDHIAAIAEAGFDTLRLPVRVADYWNGGIESDFARQMRAVVDTAHSQGLFVILDLHHFDALMDDPEAHGENFVAIWAELARMFDDLPNGLAFELLNEPRGALTTERALPLYQAALAEIRALQPDRWVIFGGGQWNHIDELANLPPDDDPRIIHTFHYYTPFEFTHQLAEWMENPMPPATWGTAAEAGRIAKDMARAAAHHTPAFLGEFGVYEKAPAADRAAWIETMRQAAEANGIPWCHWGFGAGFGAYEPDLAAWHETVRMSLMGKPGD